MKVVCLAVLLLLVACESESRPIQVEFGVRDSTIMLHGIETVSTKDSWMEWVQILAPLFVALVGMWTTYSIGRKGLAQSYEQAREMLVQSEKNLRLATDALNLEKSERKSALRPELYKLKSELLRDAVNSTQRIRSSIHRMYETVPGSIERRRLIDEFSHDQFNLMLEVSTMQMILPETLMKTLTDFYMATYGLDASTDPKTITDLLFTLSELQDKFIDGARDELGIVPLSKDMRDVLEIGKNQRIPWRRYKGEE